MPIQFPCPACGKRYRLDDALAGKRVRCRECSEAIQVPGANPPVAELVEDQVLVAEPVSQQSDPTQSSEPAPMSFLQTLSSPDSREGANDGPDPGSASMAAPPPGVSWGTLPTERRNGNAKGTLLMVGVGALAVVIVVGVVIAIVWGVSSGNAPTQIDRSSAVSTPVNGSRPPARQGEPMGWLIAAAGIFCLCGTVLNWDWFFESRKARGVVMLFGRTGARIFYGLLGSGVLIMGILLALGFIQSSR